MEPPRMPRKSLPRLIKKENEDKLEIKHQLVAEKFKSEINLQQKRAEKYQGRFLKIQAEMLTYLTKKFGNKEVRDELIKEWENNCT